MYMQQCSSWVAMLENVVIEASCVGGYSYDCVGFWVGWEIFRVAY